MEIPFTEISDLLLNCGFDRFGWAQLERPLTMDYYNSWLEEKKHGDMHYLERHRPAKDSPQLLLPKAHSALVVAVSYLPHPAPTNLPVQHLKIARYARGKDYHQWLKHRLENACSILRNLYPEDTFLPMTDSSPVLERDLARRAGLGWFGKNTCLIDQKEGSFFLIGEIYSTLQWRGTVDVAPDRCGSCTRCIDACPTGALTEHILDATRCISYHNIESRGLAPEPIRERMGTHYFGCDICQEVCPWNQKVLKQEFALHRQSPSSREEIIEDLRWILTQSGSQLEKKFRGTSLSRTPGWGHKRNAVQVAYAYRAHELRDEISALSVDPRLNALVLWVVPRLASPALP